MKGRRQKQENIDRSKPYTFTLVLGHKTTFKSILDNGNWGQALSGPAAVVNPPKRYRKAWVTEAAQVVYRNAPVAPATLEAAEKQCPSMRLQ